MEIKKIGGPRGTMALFFLSIPVPQSTGKKKETSAEERDSKFKNVSNTTQIRRVETEEKSVILLFTYTLSLALTPC